VLGQVFDGDIKPVLPVIIIGAFLDFVAEVAQDQSRIDTVFLGQCGGK
jgi:homoaconitase/3-isopropylmalate dehydratase large subunit